jgi:hypothetical protein
MSMALCFFVSTPTAFPSSPLISQPQSRHPLSCRIFANLQFRASVAVQCESLDLLAVHLQEDRHVDCETSVCHSIMAFLILIVFSPVSIGFLIHTAAHRHLARGIARPLLGDLTLAWIESVVSRSHCAVDAFGAATLPAAAAAAPLPDEDCVATVASAASDLLPVRKNLHLYACVCL